MRNQLTICSVYFNNQHLDLLKLNIQAIEKLNSSKNFIWYIANNSPANIKFRLKRPNIRVFIGVKSPNIDHPYQGSYHHALAINSLIKRVSTRFVLILDCDFFIIQKNSLERLIDYMKFKDLAFLGVPWHPKWFNKIRYFPSAHCLLIDLARVNKNHLDFRPEYTQTELKKQFGNSYTNRLINKLLNHTFFARRLIGTSKDTGYRIYKTYYNSNKHKFEIIKPHFKKEPNISRSLLDLIFPENLSLTPKKNDYSTSIDFKHFNLNLDINLPVEEFIWQDLPFGFHLRGAGRNGVMDKHKISELKDNLKQITKKILQ